MLAISAYEEAVLSATGGRQVTWRAQVKDSGGSFRDLSTYGPYNMCIDVDWGENIDGPGLDANVTLKREVEFWSLAPLVAGSPLNRALAYPGSYAALVDVGREIKIDVKVEPMGGDAAASWVNAFHGYIDELDAAQGNKLVLKCSDQQAKLRDTFIERERAYAFAQGANATKGCVIFRGSDVLSQGDLVVPTEANRNGHYYIVDAVSGPTDAEEPAWPTGSGAGFTSGGVDFLEAGTTSLTAGTDLEDCIQQIIDDNLGAGVFTLEVPSSPGWQLKAWKQDRVNVWDAIRALVDQIGWDIRFRWHSGSSTWKLTLLEPDRAKTTADRTFTASQRYPLRRIATRLSHVRTKCRVWYSDTADLDGQGRPTRKFEEYVDTAAETLYGRRFMEISEADTSQIDTSSEAATLATNCIKDLSRPICDHEGDVPFFRHVELFDLYQWNADTWHYDSNQKLAVTGYRHKIIGGDKPSARTSITTRGKPSAGVNHWLQKATGGRHEQDLLISDQLVLNSTAVVGGTQIRIAKQEAKAALPPELQLFISPDSGFTPTSATLVASGQVDQTVVPDLIPGKTYYYRVRPYSRNSSRILYGQYSAQGSFVAGQAAAGHIQQGIALGSYPLNGGFETRTDPNGMPDHWFTDAGAEVGDDILVMEDGNGLSGGRYLRLDPGNGSHGVGACHSAQIPVVNDLADGSSRRPGRLRCTAWVKMATSNNSSNNLEIYCRGYDSAGSIVGVVAAKIINAASKTGHWQLIEWNMDLSGDAGYRSVDVGFNTSYSTGQFICDVDEIRCQAIGSPWYEVGDTSGFTDNYESIPGFQNGWTNFGAPHATAAFRRTHDGAIELKGMVKSGTVGATIFTLPAGFRPAERINVGVDSNAAHGRVEIDTTGTVTCQTGNNAWVQLNNIVFRLF